MITGPGLMPSMVPCDAELGAALLDRLPQPDELVLFHMVLDLVGPQQIERRQRALGRAPRARERDLLLILARRGRLGSGARGRDRRGRLGRARRRLLERRRDAPHRELAVTGLLLHAQRQIDLHLGLFGRAGALGRALPMLRDHPLPHALLLAPLAAACAAQHQRLPPIEEPLAPGRDELSQGRLDQQGRAHDDAGQKQEERAGEARQPLHPAREQVAEQPARAQRLAAPFDLGQDQGEQRRQTDHEHRRAEAATDDLLGAAPTRLAPGRPQQQQRNEERGQPEEAEAQQRPAARRAAR